tara:strand:+ start:143 stop:715 length:573 start_codon:yes stop_codon:yes gene_type:complete
MGINSTGVAYDFGQLGSAHTDLAEQIRPPKGMVIVAIQFLADNILSELTAQVPKDDKAEYFGTAVAAHDNTTVTSTASTSGSSTTLTLASPNLSIQKGMIIESQTDTDIPISLTEPTRVVNYDRDVTVTMSAAHDVNSQTVGFFTERGSGFGGKAVSGAKFPGGMTIYGRWTSVTPAEDADGGIICYFGH